MHKMKAQSPRVSAATRHLSDSLSGFVLLETNFPHEAARSIMPLLPSMELLLKERLVEDLPEKELEWKKASTLIKGYWSGDELKLMEWVNKRANKLKHKGDPPWEDKSEVRERLLRAYPLVASLYSEFVPDIEEHFTIYERCILKGKDAPWFALANAYSKAALRYAYIDEEISVDIANKAYGIAMRGFAGVWRIEGSNYLSLPDLREVMNRHEDSEARAWYWDESVSPFRDQLREIGESPDGDRSFHPPYSLHELPSHFMDDRDKDLTQRAHYYAREIREVVLSFIDRFPLLDLTKCLIAHWNLIVEEMKQVAPDIDVPKIKPELQLGYWTYPDIGIVIDKPAHGFTVSGARPSDYWKDQHLEHFRGLLEGFCGELPEGLRL